MRRTICAGRDVVADARLDVKFVEAFSLSTAHSPAAAAPNTTNAEIARELLGKDLGNSVDLSGPRVHSHGRVVPRESLRRIWRDEGGVGSRGRFGAFQRVKSLTVRSHEVILKIPVGAQGRKGSELGTGARLGICPRVWRSGRCERLTTPPFPCVSPTQT